MNVFPRLTGTPLKALLLFGCLAAALVASPQFDPNWSRLPAGTEIPELRTSTSRTFSNGDGTLTAEVRAEASPSVDNASDALSGHDGADTLAAVGSGYSYRSYYNGYYYSNHGPDMIYRSMYVECEDAWAKFDLSPIPDSSSIYAVSFRWYQHEVFSYNIATTVRLVRTDPVISSPESLFNAINYGEITSGSESCNGIGWKERELAENGRQHVASCLGQDWVALGITEQNEAEGGHAYGTEGGELAPCLSIVYRAPDETDIKAVSSRFVTSPFIPDQVDSAALVLTNTGQPTAIHFKAYAIDRGIVQDSAVIESLAHGETTEVRLQIKAPANGGLWEPYKLTADDPRDAWHGNDTTTLTCWVFPKGTYAVEGFEQPAFPPPGWAIVDNDTGSRRWQRRADDSMQRSGDGYGFCERENGVGSNDDWLISGPVLPNSADDDAVGLCYRSARYPAMLDLQVWAMRGQAVSDTISLAAHIEITDTAYRWRSVSLDRFDGDTINVGFRDMSGGGGSGDGICLDDLWFSRVYNSGTCEPQGTVARRPELAFVPNPAAGRFVAVRYALAAGTRGRLTLRDVLGRTVKSFTLDPSGSTHLDLRGFPPGIYIATLDAAGSSISRKLIITAPK